MPRPIEHCRRKRCQQRESDLIDNLVDMSAVWEFLKERKLLDEFRKEYPGHQISTADDDIDVPF